MQGGIVVMTRESSKNSKVLEEFSAFCQDNPELRFWQALRNWSGKSFVITTSVEPIEWPDGFVDTFYREGK